MNPDLYKAATLHARTHNKPRHSAVANIFDSTKSNNTKLRQKELAKQYINEMSKDIRKHDKQEIKSALKTVINELNTGIAAASTAGGGPNTKQSSKSVTISIPLIAARILLTILKVILFTLTAFLAAILGVDLNTNTNTISTTIEYEPTINPYNGIINVLNPINERSRSNRVKSMVNKIGGFRKTRRNT